MSDLTPFLVGSQLSTVAAIATTSQVVQQIQELIDASWTFDYPVGTGATIAGSPNDFSFELKQTLNYSGTITPGVPAYTITPATYVPAVMSPAIPGYGTTNMCAPWGKCTTSVPGTPAITVTPGYTVPAVVSPAVPAVTGSYSSDVLVTATVKGFSAAINALLQSLTFVDVSDPTDDSPIQTCVYNLNSGIDGGALEVSGSAAANNIVVTIAGVQTDLGSINTGTISLSPVPDIPLEFNIDFAVPPYSVAPPEFPATSTTLAYSQFPSTSGVSIDDLAVSSGVTALTDFITSSLLNPLTSEWNALVCPVFAAVNANCPTAPTEALSNYISANAVFVQEEIDNATQNELNKLLESSLSTIQTYSEPIVVTGWNFAVYTASGAVVS